METQNKSLEDGYPLDVAIWSLLRIQAVKHVSTPNIPRSPQCKNSLIFVLACFRHDLWRQVHHPSNPCPRSPILIKQTGIQYSIHSYTGPRQFSQRPSHLTIIDHPCVPLACATGMCHYLRPPALVWWKSVWPQPGPLQPLCSKKGTGDG